jgi:type IV pilus assembly protein PilB
MARDDDYDEDDELEEAEVVSFQGPLNGKEIDPEENKRLMMAGMRPLKELLSDAVARRSELIKIDPEGPKVIVSFFVDGIKRPGPRFPGKRAVPIIHLLKLLAGLDPTADQEPQTGGMHAEYREVKLEFIVKTKPAKGGQEQITIKIRATKIIRDTPDDIGLPDIIRTTVQDHSLSGGVILICAPPETGLTTTSMCTMRCVDSYQYQCYTLGDLKGKEISNVPVFEPDPEHTLAQTFVRIKRNEAQAVYIDSLTGREELTKGVTQESIDIGIISELEAADAADGIIKYCELLGDRQIAAEHLRCVVSHKLVRKLCPKCREAFRPSSRLLAQMGLPDKTKTLYRKGDNEAGFDDDDEDEEEFEGCKRCDSVGFRGRVAIFEMIEVTDGIKEVILSGGDAAALKAKAKEEKQLSFQKDSMRLVVDGTTGLEELQRVFRPPGGPKRKKRPMKKRPMRKQPRRFE